MTTLYLARHGETDNNGKGAYNGCREDQALNENGKRQAVLPLLHLPASRIRHIDDLTNTAFWRLEVFDDGTFNVTEWNATPHLPPELKMLTATSNCAPPFSAPQIMGEHIFPDFERKV